MSLKWAPKPYSTRIQALVLLSNIRYHLILHLFIYIWFNPTHSNGIKKSEWHEGSFNGTGCRDKAAEEG